MIVLYLLNDSYKTMTSRWLKDDDGKFILGKNGKKLRYLFYKKTGLVQTTFDSNWTDNSLNKLKDIYGENVERVQTKRGRPKKTNERKKKVKRKKEKKLNNTAQTNDTSDEEDTYNIDGYELVERDGEQYYKNNKDWMFNLEGDYIGHYDNDGRFINN